MTPLAEVRRALVVGAGTMGHGIAQVLAKSGIAVDLVDTSRDVLDHARRRIDASLANLGRIGVIPPGDVSAVLMCTAALGFTSIAACGGLLVFVGSSLSPMSTSSLAHPQKRLLGSNCNA